MNNDVSLLDEQIRSAKESFGGALIGYLPLGYPTLDKSIQAAITLYENGFDVVELGIPYSDPVMDGIVIQEATKQALENGFSLTDVFYAVSEVRKRTDKPIILMGYWNPVMQYGPDRFCEELKAAGGNGMITPDLIPDEAAEWIAAANKHQLDKIFLAAKYSTPERLKMIQNKGSGFIYAVSTMGVTGTRESVDSAAHDLVERIQAAGDNPVCIGIGISRSDHVREVLEYADGAIVGTALVRALKEGGLSALKDLALDLSSYKRENSGTLNND